MRFDTFFEKFFGKKDNARSESRQRSETSQRGAIAEKVEIALEHKRLHDIILERESSTYSAGVARVYGDDWKEFRVAWTVENSIAADGQPESVVEFFSIPKFDLKKKAFIKKKQKELIDNLLEFLDSRKEKKLQEAQEVNRKKESIEEARATLEKLYRQPSAKKSSE